MTWEFNGFQRVDHVSEITDWDDDDVLATVHYPEIERLAKMLTGAPHALVASHISRNVEKAKVHSDYAPIQFVHSDFADDYGDLIKKRYKRGYGHTEAALERAGLTVEDLVQADRVLILQTWRNVGPVTPNYPLAFCDPTSVDPKDLSKIHLNGYAGDDFAFDVLAVRAPDSAGMHQWYTYPNLTKDEVVVFRTFDSKCVAEGRPFWTPHCAFRDPGAREDNQRRSIEIRAMCLF